jgi:uncharacterized protein
VFLSLIFRSLQGRSDWRGSRLKRFIAAAKYVLRCLCMPRRQRRWLSFVFDSPAMMLLALRDPRMYERAQHHYISRRFAPARRFEIIESHYRSVFAHFPGKLVRSLHVRGHASLGKLRLKDGSDVELRLSRPTGRGREGELALYLLQADGQTLSSMIFTLADEGRSLLIGCMQGAAQGLGRDAVREFTKQAYGLRPKNLLLSMLYAFAAAMKIDNICGIGNQAHPFAGSSKIKADYDAFWSECHGVLLDDGLYRLPSHEPVRDAALVESKHRSTFRRRELLREQACVLMFEMFDPQRLPLAA